MVSEPVEYGVSNQVKRKQRPDDFCYPGGSIMLGDKYQPHQFDVICGRGKHVFYHHGNIVFREKVSSNVHRYRQARCRMAKSLIVTSIVDDIRSKTPNGGFVKYLDKAQCWVEIGDIMARDKVGHALRDCICSADSDTKLLTGTWHDQPSKLSPSSSAVTFAKRNHEPEEGMLTRLVSETSHDEKSKLGLTSLAEMAKSEEPNEKMLTQQFDASYLLRIPLISIPDTNEHQLSNCEEFKIDSLDRVTFGAPALAFDDDASVECQITSK